MPQKNNVPHLHNDKIFYSNIYLNQKKINYPFPIENAKKTLIIEVSKPKYVQLKKLRIYTSRKKSGQTAYGT